MEARGLTRFFFILTHTFSITLEVFLRRKFGERYFLSLHVLLAIITFIVYIGYSNGVFGSIFGNNDASVAEQLASGWKSPFFYFGVMFLILSFWHLFSIQVRDGKGEKIYSRSSGESWLYLQNLPVNQKTFQRFIEPLLCIIIAYLFSDKLGAVSIWITIASACLFAKGQIEYQRSREFLLDRDDAEIESGRSSGGEIKHIVSLAAADSDTMKPSESGETGYMPESDSIIKRVLEIAKEVSEEAKEVFGGIVPHAKEVLADPVSRFIVYNRITFWAPLLTMFSFFYFPNFGDGNLYPIVSFGENWVPIISFFVGFNFFLVFLLLLYLLVLWNEIYDHSFGHLMKVRARQHEPDFILFYVGVIVLVTLNVRYASEWSYLLTPVGSVATGGAIFFIEMLIFLICILFGISLRDAYPWTLGGLVSSLPDSNKRHIKKINGYVYILTKILFTTLILVLLIGNFYSSFSPETKNFVIPAIAGAIPIIFFISAVISYSYEKNQDDPFLFSVLRSLLLPLFVLLVGFAGFLISVNIYLGLGFVVLFFLWFFLGGKGNKRKKGS